jgi:hypothetical protein
MNTKTGKKDFLENLRSSMDNDWKYRLLDCSGEAISTILTLLFYLKNEFHNINFSGQHEHYCFTLMFLALKCPTKTVDYVTTYSDECVALLLSSSDGE